MPENNSQPLGADSENFYNEYYDNSSRQLKRHVYVNNRGEYDHDIADFIFKKAGYTCTYIVVHTTGIPDGVILNLCDENSNQLYSPVDTNKNWITTACSITVGETDIIPLPAQFNNELSNHVPFPVGTYNWKLVFAGNDYYEGIELPLTVEIRDFKVWDIQTPQIYPNEDIKVKVQTNANTLYPPTFDMSPLLTDNATYDYETGIITYPNQDITDLSTGKHMQVINSANNCFIDYEIKNPIYCSVEKSSYTYGEDIGFDAIISQGCSLRFGYYKTVGNIFNVDNTLSIPPGGQLYDEQGTTALFKTLRNHTLTPGTHTLYVSYQFNDVTYECYVDFEITTENCVLYLAHVDSNDFPLSTMYIYNDTPIPNAKVQLIVDDIVAETKTTNNDGYIAWDSTPNKNYKAVAIDYHNSHILESNSLYHSLSVTGPNIIQKDENVSIKAQLTDYNNNPIKNATINFYEVTDE